MNKIGVNRLYNQDLAHTFFNSSLSGELLPISATIPIGGASMLTLGQPDISLLSDVVNTVSSFIGNVVNLDGEINTQSSHFVSDESFSSLNLASRAMQNEIGSLSVDPDTIVRENYIRPDGRPPTKKVFDFSVLFFLNSLPFRMAGR
jgi:hypothetical protein